VCIIFNQGGGRFFEFSERIRPKNKLGVPVLGQDLLQKRKKEKTANPEFQIIKKKKNPPHSSTNQTQFGLDSRYFKEPGSQFQLAENLDLSSKTCSKN
jgi:hypothetical protein